MKKKAFYKRTFRAVRDVIILRSLRKKIKFHISQKRLKKFVEQLESELSGKIVYIFQHQFFDINGENCYNGGAERYSVDLADILHENGYVPILIQIGNDKKDKWEKKVGNLKIIGLPVDKITYMNIVSLFKKYEFVIYSGAVDWGNKCHPNILISHGVTWDAPNKDVRMEYILNIFLDVDQIVSVDTNTLSWLRTTFPLIFEQRKMDYIPNYVDTDIYKPIPKNNTDVIQITFPRRASPERGYWLMSDALPPILDKYSHVIFDFVGFAHGEKIETDINKLIKKYPGRIRHYVCDPSDMYKVYQKTDISLIPTLYAEGTSLSCLEAQACGNIVISTNIGGLPNLIIDGYNGLLINPSGSELMQALDKVISNKALQKKLSTNAVAVAQSFDKKIWKNRWNDIIKRKQNA